MSRGLKETRIVFDAESICRNVCGGLLQKTKARSGNLNGALTAVTKGMDYVNIVLINQRKEDGQSVFDVCKMNVFVASEKS